jgi:16S rRNA (cytidine1402-2'-O)-methyltransferase
MMLQVALYMIPTNISDAPLTDVLPAYNMAITKQIRYFIVENLRTARRFLKKCDREFPIDECTFYELNQHTDPRDISSFLEPLRKGYAMGVMSEAGVPGVADPGASAVEIAQREGRKVIPLVGPSSILLALMASGFNGQSFAFNGYLPIDNEQRVKSIKSLESHSRRFNQTQIFIETPYRNRNLLDLLVRTLHPDTKICVAVNITGEDEKIITHTAAKWRQLDFDPGKNPAIFLIYSL